MTKDSQGTPIEEDGGYGTPTVEQELGGADAKKFAQPREEEAFDAEDQDSAGEPGAGRFGGTEDQMNAENESTDAGVKPDNSATDNAETESTARGNDSAAESADAAVPSADAEMDESNTEDPDAGRPFSSEPAPDAAGIPDGSGTDLPDSKAPKDRDDDTFDAG
jgi:hypothetical protein